jgi:hypothetical protein
MIADILFAPLDAVVHGIAGQVGKPDGKYSQRV